VVKTVTAPAERKPVNSTESESLHTELELDYIRKANEMVTRALYFHVHVQGSYRVSLPNKAAVLDYIRRLVRKHNPDEEPKIHEGRDAISYHGDTEGITLIQAMVLPGHLLHLIPRIVMPEPCASGGCPEIVTPCLYDECSTAGCGKLLCHSCIGKGDTKCARHASG